MALKLITPPEPIVTWEQADAHLRLSGDIEQKAFVESLIAAATAHLDGWNGILGRAIGLQTWDFYLDSFPCEAMRLPLGPLSSVTSVNYVNADGDEVVLDTDNYEVDTVSTFGWVVPVSGVSWPSIMDTINAVRVRFVAGSAGIPAPLTAAILLLVGHLFENREAVSMAQPFELPLAVDRLISPYRRIFTA